MISRQKLIEELNSYHYTAIGMRCGKKVTAEIIKGYHDHVIEVIESQPPAEPYVPLSEVYEVIAGHSDYHGDDILAALTCIAEGKEVKPVKPLPADVPDTNVGEWIPCSERLPKFLQPCFITVQYCGLVTTFRAVYWESHWSTENENFNLENVTAWMPAEPYRGYI